MIARILLPLALFSLATACVPLFDTEPADRVVDTGADGFTGDGVCCTETACLVLTEEQCEANAGTYQEGLSCEEAGCFPTCRDYCGTWLETCDDRFPREFGPITGGDCFEFCERMDWNPGRFAAPHPDTNSIGCRIYHMGNARGSEANQDLHCPHSGATGGGVCGDWCDNYCHLADRICGDIDFEVILETAPGADLDREAFLATFADRDVCATWCRGEGNTEAIPTNGRHGDTTGDSIQCRMYHLLTATDVSAPRDRAQHCGHGGIVSFERACVGELPGPATDAGAWPDEYDAQ